MDDTSSSHLRTCVACRKKADKGELVRIVRRPDGSVALDEGGKAAGRGAYVCPATVCFEKAVEKKVLNGALRTGLSAAQTEEIRLTFSRLIAHRAQEIGVE